MIEPHIGVAVILGLLVGIYVRVRSRKLPKKIEKFNVRTYAAVCISVVILFISLMLVPGVLIVYRPTSSKEALSGIIIILSVVMVVGSILLYSVRKGDLSWIRIYKGR